MTIITFPLLFLGLVSGMVLHESRNGEILYKKTSSIVSARAENLTKEQISLLNHMVSKLNKNIGHMVRGKTLDEFKNNKTAVEKMAKSVKDDIFMYNSLVIHMFNLTEKELTMTRSEFCQAVEKICDKTYVVPSELKPTPTYGTEMLETLHKDHKDLIDGAIPHPKYKTVDPFGGSNLEFWNV